MADRYWVGGTANWDGTAGTKWATTSGGAGGASVPTSADDVYFDANSGAVTVTVSASVNCLNLDFTGFTGVITGTGTINVYGSITRVSGMTWSHTGNFALQATSGSYTITNGGKSFGANLLLGVVVAGSATWTLQDALVVNNNIIQTNGTFDTANYNVTASALSSTNSNTRTINLGSSTVTLSSTTPVNFSTSTNLTFNAGTSTLVFTSTGTQNVNNGTTGITFYNVTCGSTSATGATLFNSTSPLTFNDLTCTAMSTAGVRQVWFYSPATINGTLSTSGTAGNRRVWFQSGTYGIAQTLTINSAPSLTDADFRDIYVIGTAAPISGTRVGDLRGCRGITFDTPKTVYWNLAAGGNWSANAWAASSGGAVSTDNFPLAQDTAVIENTGLNTSATVTIDSAFSYTGALSTQTRTNAFTLGGSNPMTFHGNLTLSSAVTLSYNGTITFSGRNIQTITSAGKAFSSNLVIDSYGGTVELGDAFSVSGNNLTITNGTFDTKNYNVTAGALSSSNNNVRAITLGSSTVTLSGSSPVSLANSLNLTFNAGTSQITITANPGLSFEGGGNTFYDLSFTGTGGSGTVALNGNNNQFRNLTFSALDPAVGLRVVGMQGNNTITGTLTVAGATAVRRIFARSDTLGTTRTLTVGTLSADDCDFRDITIAGTAAGSSPTRAGDCGGNSGITFPSPKTVYWNLAGTQNWSATAWASSSGGTPDINQFPLAQDTAVFDDTGSAGTVTIQAFNIGTFDASARTSAMTLTTGSNTPFVYGDWKFGTGVTSSSTTGTITFAKRGTQTITSNGVTFGCPITVDSITGLVQLADALTLGSTRALTLISGTFDAVTYSVTIAAFLSAGSTTRTLKMGSGLWTLALGGTVWDVGSSATNLNFYKGTADIVLSNTTTSSRSFVGGNLSYNKLTIGGTTGISSFNISGNNQFTELASTKTVAHTIALGSTTQTFGKWTVTGTVGNVVTLTGTGTAHILAGACTDSIDYLAMGSIGFAATSPGEFYAGANSTGTAAAPVYRTAKPADSTRYWVGGTGNWSDTARWSTSSGGASGAAVPRSHDDVVFDSLSNATAYTATVNAVTGGIRCKALTIAGPLVGNVTLAGSTAIVGIHGNVTLPATGLTRTYTGAITLSGSTSGLTLTTNGVALASSITLDGVGCEWVLGSALDLSTVGGFTLVNGVFDCVTYNLTCGGITCSSSNIRTFDFGSGTITTSGSSGAFAFGTTETTSADLTIVAGTAQINCTGSNPTFSGNGKTFYNVAFTDTSAGTVTINGANSFNNLSFTGITSAGLKVISVTANQTITGTFTCSAGTNATMRHFVRSDTIGTTRTLTCAAVSLTDVDFRDITIAGVAAPATGTRIGDCKGNSGITFTAAANKYWNLAAGGNWGGAIGWATSSGGSPAINNFPLAQDTCFFEATGLNSGATITINQAYNIGTIDMSARTTNTMTLATGSTTPAIYGNWINGTGTTLTGTGTLTFSNRGSQTVTSAGKTFNQTFDINTPNGSVTLLDAITVNGGVNHIAGTFDANGYNFTSSASFFANAGNQVRTLAIGSGLWTISSSSNPWNAASTNLTVTGTGTISLTSASAKTFAGGNVSYSGITLNQGGNGTLTISGNNTFKTISSTAAGANTIAMGTTTQRVTTSWTASGSAGNILTVQGSSATSPCTLVFTGSGQAADVDYLAITGVRAYPL
jgi:hypothetical protein